MLAFKKYNGETYVISGYSYLKEKYNLPATECLVNNIESGW